MTAKNNFLHLIKSTQGQGMIEALALAIALLGFGGVLGGVFYFSVVHSGISYLLHENLVCEMTEGSGGCRKDFLDKAKPFLILAKIQIFESSSSAGKYSNHVQIQMPLKRTLHLQKEMVLYR